MKKTVFGMMATFLLATTLYAAGIPGKINYHGKLLNAQGQEVADGQYTVTFSLYPEAGAGAPVWQETKTVTTRQGYFNTILGESPALDPAQFRAGLWLGLRVGADPEMTPRQPLFPVPSALNVVDGAISAAKIENGAVSSDKLAPMAVTSDKIANNSITLDKAGPEMFSAMPGMGKCRMQFGVTETFNGFVDYYHDVVLPVPWPNKHHLFFACLYSGSTDLIPFIFWAAPNGLDKGRISFWNGYELLPMRFSWISIGE